MTGVAFSDIAKKVYLWHTSVSEHPHTILNLPSNTSIFLPVRLEHGRLNMPPWSCEGLHLLPNSLLRLGLATLARGFTLLILGVDNRIVPHICTYSHTMDGCTRRPEPHQYTPWLTKKLQTQEERSLKIRMRCIFTIETRYVALPWHILVKAWSSSTTDNCCHEFPQLRFLLTAFAVLNVNSYCVPR